VPKISSPWPVTGVLSHTAKPFLARYSPATIFAASAPSAVDASSSASAAGPGFPLSIRTKVPVGGGIAKGLAGGRSAMLD
jgi:hypothetical protein